MDRFVTLEDALRCTVLTAKEQPSQVPEAPAGWLERAEAALAFEDDAQISAEARAIVRAHALYRAEPEMKAWLYELRIAVRDAG